MATTTTQPLGLPLGKDGGLVIGNVKTYSDGKAEWYRVGDNFPTLTSSQSDNYTWKFVEQTSITNLRNFINQGSGTIVYATDADLSKAFYSTDKSTKSLNNARLSTFNSPTGLNSPELAKELEIPGATNTASSTQSSGSNSGSQDSDTIITSNDLSIDQIKGDEKYTRKWSGETYIYPTGVERNGQDYIKFDIVNYTTKNINTSSGGLTLSERSRTTTNRLASIILPIQPSITDSNTVDWNGQGLNPIQLSAIGISGAGMEGDIGKIEDILEALGSKVTGDENIKKAITLQLKQKAVGVEGLLSRFGGAIVNPNLELLFQGPQLRPFNFTFRLSPRNALEATKVRSIIRSFKEAMAPQVSSGGLFLSTPNVFNIRYIRGVDGNNKDRNHPSLNRIKTCALQSCNVDYTPDGSYMTFNDEAKTMTSYSLTLQFQELEPVTSKDYFDNDKQIPADEIGY